MLVLVLNKCQFWFYTKLKILILFPKRLIFYYTKSILIPKGLILFFIVKYDIEICILVLNKLQKVDFILQNVKFDSKG